MFIKINLSLGYSLGKGEHRTVLGSAWSALKRVWLDCITQTYVTDCQATQLENIPPPFYISNTRCIQLWRISSSRSAQLIEKHRRMFLLFYRSQGSSFATAHAGTVWSINSTMYLGIFANFKHRNSPWSQQSIQLLKGFALERRNTLLVLLPMHCNRFAPCPTMHHSAIILLVISDVQQQKILMCRIQDFSNLTALGKSGFVWWNLKGNEQLK